jgi:hypothetical protein
MKKDDESFAELIIAKNQDVIARLDKIKNSRWRRWKEKIRRWYRNWRGK